MSDTDPYGAPTVEYPVRTVSDNKAEAVVPEKTSVQTPDPAPEAVVAADGTETHEVVLDVPEGTVAAVMDWVGDSKERAEAALKAEKAGKDRASLITKLEEILN